MRFPNLVLAIAHHSLQYRFGAVLLENQSWLSRRLNGRVEFSFEERRRVTDISGSPVDGLFSSIDATVEKNIPAVEILSEEGT
jgi:hypothetical protein